MGREYISNRASTLPAAAVLFLFAFTGFVCAQELDVLWTPPGGYRLLSTEERQSLPPEQLRTIVARNTELVAAALASMSTEERDALARSLLRVSKTHTLSISERQYVTQVQMRLTGIQESERLAPEVERRKRAYEKLLAEQESSSGGFSSDRELVEREAEAIEAQIPNEDLRGLYLRTLKLSARVPGTSGPPHVPADRATGSVAPSGHVALRRGARVFPRARKGESAGGSVVLSGGLVSSHPAPAGRRIAPALRHGNREELEG